MKSHVLLQSLAAVCIATTAYTASAQSIQLFSPVNVRVSTSGTSFSSPNTFNTTILNLSCPSSPQAAISSSADGTGNVLVDNYISLQVGQVGPVNICSGIDQSCFTSSYQTDASAGQLTNQDPDNFVSTGGVPPIDISSYFSPGAVQAQIGLVDQGGYLASSTLYLVTNCSSAGVAGPGLVTGNPISASNPTSQQLAQNYSFNSTTNQQVQFTYDLTAAQNAGTLSITDQSTPSTGDTPLNPALFPNYVNGTSFATANCLTHTGELYNGSPACKLYTLTCQIGSNPTQAGALCPASKQRNEVFQEVFDGPGFTLPDIAGTNGLTYHQGVGFLEAAEKWGGGSCTFDQNSGIAQQLCPQNVLVNFSGPGVYKTGGSGQSPNSTFITVAPVPEPLTTVSVTGLQQPGNWINTHSPTVNFDSTPPAISSNNNFVAAPIETLTYGISPASSVPQPPAPVPNDTTLTNNGACPAPQGSAPANPFTPPAQTVSVSADGNYVLHYYAQDCAGTQELQFLQVGGSWSTAFYTYPINVDTVNPVVATGPTLSPPPSTNNGVANSYLVGQAVTATYSCTDTASPIVNSGVVKCGTATFPVGTLNTGNVSGPVNTSTAGSQTFTVNAVDAAGNTATTASVTYQVVAPPPANLSILKVAPLTVKHGAQLIYGITAVNLGKQAASVVMISDPLPSGVTFVKAAAQQASCTKGQCVCTFAGNTVTCSVPTLTLLTPALVEIYVNVTANAGTTITNTATVSSANPEGKGIAQSTAKTLVK